MAGDERDLSPLADTEEAKKHGDDHLACKQSLRGRGYGGRAPCQSLQSRPIRPPPSLSPPGFSSSSSPSPSSSSSPSSLSALLQLWRPGTSSFSLSPQIELPHHSIRHPSPQPNSPPSLHHRSVPSLSSPLHGSHPHLPFRPCPSTTTSDSFSGFFFPCLSRWFVTLWKHMGGALFWSLRHWWCRKRWNEPIINSPDDDLLNVPPETFRQFKDVRPNPPPPLHQQQQQQQQRPHQPQDCSPSSHPQSGALRGKKIRGTMHESDQQRIQVTQEVEFFTEYGEAHRYVLQEVIGKGSYGVVCSAIDTHTGEKVAIKKINDIFEHISDATRILREIKLLRLLRHPDIVEVKHILLPPSRREFRDIYVVFELMESDLHQVIKANDDLTPEHYQFFLYQLLRALKYIHTANVFHRDLKPKNVLANADCKLKICDFGLARVAFSDAPTAIFWTDYVATRWYRAPELCGSFFSKYTPAVDIWSIGCIFAEVLGGRPLFPGKNVVHQLDLITDLLGSPSPEAISRIRNEKARKYLTGMRKKLPIPFSQKFPNVNPMALRLLGRLLAFDPKDRPTAEEALADPYFKGLAKIEREPSAPSITKVEFEFERRRVSKEDVRELIYREILEYHPQMLKEYLYGKNQGHFMYPSAVDQFRRQFSYLEEHYLSGSTCEPPERQHTSLPRERVQDEGSKHSRETEKHRHGRGITSVAKATLRASQKAFQGGHARRGKVGTGLVVGSDASKEVSHPRRLVKSASVSGSLNTSGPDYLRRNPSVKVEVDKKKVESTSELNAVQSRSHLMGFEWTKKQAAQCGSTRL